MNEEQLEIMRHSLSHIMAQSVIKLYPKAKLAIGPAIDNGFYYDFDLGEESFSKKDLKSIEKEMRKIISKDQKFEQFSLPIEEAKKLVADNPYKLEMIGDLAEQGEVEIKFYKNIDQDGHEVFVDMCRGPHVVSTKEVGAFKLHKVAGAYWRGDEKNKMLQRVYGLAYETKEEIDNYLNLLEEAEKRDHNKIGKKLGIFMGSNLIGQGLPLLTPKGTKIKQILQRWIEDEEEKRGYQLTMTPLMAKSDLYKVSGHWDHYKDGMFVVDGSGEEMALRPMTCPFQFQIYNSERRSYRDLPIRYNETSTLFRNESSGEMHGLIRLRQFTLSEGHIICRMDQLATEFDAVLDLINYILKTLDLKDFWYRFSKWSPDNKKGKYIDNPEAWEKSQAMLKEILDKNKLEYTEVEDEAAFYGPKLDIQMKNVYGKEDTIITVQIDFALPEKFDMTYTNNEGVEERPIIIHRSSIGAYERTMALLIERYAGAFPVWLSPEQVRVLPVSEKFEDYATQVVSELKKVKIRAELDNSSESLSKRIRNGEKSKTPYLLVVGEKEKNEKTVAVRKRGSGSIVEVLLVDFVSQLVTEDKDKVVD